MNSTQPAHVQPATPDDPRVVAAVEEYVRAAEAGERPDRQAFLTRHPDIADALAGCLDGLEFIQAARPQLDDAAATEEAFPAPLGDFRIVREVGRGGMGIVYEAEQMSLGRRVALKVLPFAATMDSRQLQRFKNEARAAALLEHPHIVPVYGVGCERGVHYYAMKFIEGQSLAEVIGELKKAKELNHRGTEDTEKKQQTAASSLCSLCLCGSKDFYKSVAELGIQAAEALEHAHSVGIVHRDIKPANLMIDGHSALWVTDFGLARTAADGGLTMTGDVLGTLRYMSPEQALAKHGLVDHRTDVYSLGVTLYELLTGTPAVTGKDREEILNAITLESPRPPRAFDPAIPRDLETIVLKALAKDAADRYATAMELANDLRCYQEQRPIAARRPSWLQRVRRWTRRHQAVVTSIAVTIAVGLALSMVLVWREHEKTLAAGYETQLQQALVQEREQRLRRQHYPAEINAAYQAWRLGDIAAMRAILARLVPEESQEEQRGFEWFYLNRQCRDESDAHRVLAKDQGEVYHVRFSPNGRILASTGQQGMVTLWDVAKGGILRTWKAHQDDVNWVAFSSDGTMLVSAGDDATVHLWDVECACAPVVLSGGSAEIVCAEFSPDGKLVAAGDNAGKLRVWDVASGELKGEVEAHKDRIEALAFAPDGKLIWTAGKDEWARPSRPIPLTTIQPGVWNGNPFTTIACSPDGKLVAGAGVRSHVALLHPVGIPLGKLATHAETLQAVAFSPDSSFLASAGDSGIVTLWDVRIQALQTRFLGHAGRVWSLAFSSDGKTLVSAGRDGTIRLWRRDHHRGVSRVEEPAGVVSALAFDTKDLVIGSVALPNKVSLRALPEAPSAIEFKDATLIALSPNTRICAIASGNHHVLRLLDRRDHREDSVSAGAYCRGLAFSPDGRWVAFLTPAHAWPDWLLMRTEPPLRFQTKFGGRGLALGPDDKTAAVAQQDGRVCFYPIEPRPDREPFGVDLNADGLAFSADGKMLACWRGNRVVLLDVERKEITHQLSGHRADVSAAVFSPDGRTLATASRDGSVKLWHTATGRELFTLVEDATEPLRTIAFSPDGLTLAAGGESRKTYGKILVWSADGRRDAEIWSSGR